MGADDGKLSALWEHVPVGVVVLDRDLRICRSNAAWRALIAGGAPAFAAGGSQGASLLALPGLGSALRPRMQRLLAGEKVAWEAVRLDLEDGVAYWDIVIGPLEAYGDRDALVCTVIDVTEQRRAQAALRQQIAFEDLVTSIAARFIHLDVDEIDGGISQALADIGAFTGVDRCYVFLFSHGNEQFSCTHEWNAAGIAPQIDALQGLPVRDWSWSNDQILSGQALYVPRVADLPPEAAVERREFERQGILSLLVVPLVWRGATLGFLGLDAVRAPKTWPEQDISLLRVAGEVFASAIENRRALQALQRAYRTMEQQVEERTREIERRRQVAESLRDVVSLINANAPLPEILDRIVHQAAVQLDAAACALSRLDQGVKELVHEAVYGWPDELRNTGPIPFSAFRAMGADSYWESLLKRQPIYGNYGPLPERLDEIRRDPTIPPGPKARRLLIRTLFAGSMGIPLVIGDQVYGGLGFYYAQPQAFSDEQVRLATTFAEQAALAIENAQLRERAAQSAAQAERNRLARELHDAVTQTLFSATMIAEVLPRLWDRRPEEGRRRLDELRDLTRGALAEMRALLLELRPSALAEAPLDDLLRQLGEAIAGRARVRVDVSVEGACEVPQEAKIALYRIAQEALNNVAKHAHARSAAVRLCCEPGQAALTIADDGVGFDLARAPQDHFGLGNMRERAEAIGATLEVRTGPARGTQVAVTWEADREERRGE
ncbi:MAG: GAF domain-containing protein [Anaerolineae bacterium]|nr:GAF domain-containing protein [Anaerolineae bacterium]